MPRISGRPPVLDAGDTALVDHSEGGYAFGRTKGGAKEAAKRGKKVAGPHGANSSSQAAPGSA